MFVMSVGSSARLCVDKWIFYSLKEYNGNRYAFFLNNDRC